MRAALVLLTLAGCGRVGFDARTTTGAGDGGSGGDSGDAASPLAFGSPMDGAVVGLTATLTGTCAQGVTIALSGDLTAPASAPCDAGTFSILVTFTPTNGSKTITLAQGTATVSRSFSMIQPAVVHRAGAEGYVVSQGLNVNCTLSVPLPAGVVDGDLLVGIIYTDAGSGAAIETTGWTRMSLSSGAYAAFYKTASTEPSMYSFAITAGTGPNDTCESGGAITAFTAMNGTATFGFDMSATQTAVTSIVTPSITVPASGMLVALYGSNGPSTGITGPAGMTSDPGAASTGDWGDALIAWGPVSAGPTGTRTATIQQARDAACALAYLHP